MLPNGKLVTSNHNEYHCITHSDMETFTAANLGRPWLDNNWLKEELGTL